MPRENRIKKAKNAEFGDCEAKSSTFEFPKLFFCDQFEI